MVVRLLGRVIEVSLVQELNAEYPMVVTLLGIVKEVRTWQEANVAFPIEVTLSGMTTEVREYLMSSLANTLSPILTVGYPPRVEGIVTAPPAPVYFVRVACPLLTV
jgi:hypothetical protein